jgi:hypothetical protein
VLEDETLVASLPLDAGELSRRLADPGLPPMPEGGDPLAIVGWVETVMAREVAKMDPEAAVARRQALALVVQAAKGRAAILKDLGPQEETPEVLAGREVERVRDRAISRLIEKLDEEEAAAAA